MNFLIQASLIFSMPLLFWLPLRRFVPLVLVQILCGILIGPSLLGRLAPELYASVFPPNTGVALSSLSALAIVCVGFIAGMELELDELKHQARRVLHAGFLSYLIPAVGGGCFAWWAGHQWPELLGERATSGVFAVAGSICFGVTALPVLAAILREMNLSSSRLGHTSLTLAAINDLLLWSCLTALMLATSQPNAAQHAWVWLLLPVLLAAGFIFRPWLRKWFESLTQMKELSTSALSIVLVGLFLSASVSEMLGMHAVIGSFIFGMLLPKALRQHFTKLTAPFSNAVLLPFFFVSAGLSLDISASPAWMFFMLSVVVGSGLKIISTAIPVHAWGWSWREALQLGALMQSKGLMEIVVLRALYDAGIISQSCLTALLLMALVCTALAMPLTRGLAPQIHRKYLME